MLARLDTLQLARSTCSRLHFQIEDIQTYTALVRQRVRRFYEKVGTRNLGELAGRSEAALCNAMIGEIGRR